MRINREKEFGAVYLCEYCHENKNVQNLPVSMETKDTGAFLLLTLVVSCSCDPAVSRLLAPAPTEATARTDLKLRENHSLTRAYRFASDF